MSANVPADFAQVGSVVMVPSKPAAGVTPTRDNMTVISGISLNAGDQYYVVASGKHILAAGRYADADSYMQTTSTTSWKVGTHLHVSTDNYADGVNYTANWGATHDDNNVYGSLITGQGAPLKAYISDSNYSDNSESISLTIWKQLPQVSIGALSDADESLSDGSVGNGTFVVARTGSTSDPLTVNIAVDTTVASAASPGVDYASLPVSVTIPAGASEVTVQVVPIQNGVLDPDRIVHVSAVSASGPNGYTVSQSFSSADVTIHDGYTAPAVSLDGYSDRSEEPDSPTGNAVDGDFTIEAIGYRPSNLNVLVQIGGDADFAVDYELSGGAQVGPNLFEVVIPAGTDPASSTVTIHPLYDGITEGIENVTFTILEPSSDGSNTAPQYVLAAERPTSGQVPIGEGGAGIDISLRSGSATSDITKPGTWVHINDNFDEGQETEGMLADYFPDPNDGQYKIN